VWIANCAASPYGAAEPDCYLPMPQSLSAVTIHFVFSTKDRAPLITDTIAPELHAYIGGIIRAEKCVPVAVGGMADHVHLLISMSREISLAELVRVIKSGSSKWMHEKGHRDFAWQAGYAAFSVSQSNVESVRSYIAQQAQHHRRMPFREEYLLFLQRHGIAYDERYMWG
jgi:putative transposase